MSAGRSPPGTLRNCERLRPAFRRSSRIPPIGRQSMPSCAAPGSIEAGVPAIVADSADRASIDAFVRRTRIVLSTAGPFELYSDAVVDACVRLNSHYVDITGE